MKIKTTLEKKNPLTCANHNQKIKITNKILLCKNIFYSYTKPVACLALHVIHVSEELPFTKKCISSTDLPKSHQIGVSLDEIVVVVWGGSPSELGQQNVGSEQAIDLSDVVQVVNGQGRVVWQHTYLCKKYVLKIHILLFFLLSIHSIIKNLDNFNTPWVHKNFIILDLQTNDFDL